MLAKYIISQRYLFYGNKIDLFFYNCFIYLFYNSSEVKNSEGPIRGPFELSYLVGFSLATPIFSFIFVVIFLYLCSMKLFFRTVAFLEGISYILLITIGLYFKYQLNDESWDAKDFRIVLLASLMPFGTFYIDRKYF
jgi:hypothetical protein